MELKELVEQLNSANTELKNMRDKHDAEVKANGEATAEVKAKLEQAESKYDELQTEFKSTDDRLKELEAKMARPQFGHGQERKSFGEQFVSSDVMDMLSKGDGFNRRVEVKDITGTAASAIALVDDYRDPEVYRSIGGRRQLRIQDLLPRVPVASGSVEVMRQNSFTNNAAMQAPSSPSTAAGAGELQTKAKSDITWELVTLPVRTLAHHVIASRQVLSDAPQLQALIDTELQYGLQLFMDDQLLNGDGANQNFTGILTDAAINDVGELASTTTAADVPSAMINHIRAAVTECQKNEYYNINGIVLNPVDWQILETARATDGHYLLVAFAATAAESPTVWRVPVIVSNAMPESSFVLGDWQMGAKLYVREGVSIRVSESHANLFVENGVAVLGEERACLGINRPKAFCKGLFTVAA